MLPMMRTVEELARHAASLPDDQKLALANRILEQTEQPKTSEVEQVWEEELRKRVRAYDAARKSTRAASEVFRDLDSKLQ